MDKKPVSKKAVILIGSITAAVFLACLIWAALVLRPADTQLVEIVQDGTVIRTLDLQKAADEDIRIPSADGGYNLVQIRDHTICIAEADCHDQTCVHMGLLHSESLPIVCLPHKLIIRYVEE